VGGSRSITQHSTQFGDLEVWIQVKWEGAGQLPNTAPNYYKGGRTTLLTLSATAVVMNSMERLPITEVE